MHPPKWPLKFLRWFCRSEQIDEVEGDLIELYELRHAKSTNSARWRFAWDVLRSFRPTNVKKLKIFIMSKGIINHTFKNGLRQMSSNRLFATINIAGITLSFLAFFMISLFVYDELSFDQFHSNYDRLYRVLKTDTLRTYRAAITPPAIAPSLLETYPEITDFTRVYQIRQMQAKYENEEMSLQGLLVDSSFFKLFTFPVVSGQKEGLLFERDKVILTQHVAQTYFEDGDALDKTVMFNGHPFIVSAIVSTPPDNSQIQFDYLLPMQGLWSDKKLANWKQSFLYTYVLASIDDPGFVNQKMSRFLMENDPSYVNGGLMLQPMSEIHLDADVEFNNGPKGDRKFVNIFLVVGIVIMLIAGINFMNLTMARATHRVKEVGVRKLIGAQRNTIILHFIGETFLIVSMSMLLALAAFVLTLPIFNGFSGKNFSLSFLMGTMPISSIAVMGLGVVVLLSLLSGMYPALVISAISPINLIKGWVNGKVGNMFVGRSLTVIQFSVSIMLVICSLIAMKQLNFIQTKSLGWDQNNLINIPLKQGMFDDFEVFKTELLGNDAIENVTWVSELPVDVGTGGTITFEGMNPEKNYAAYYINAGKDFYKTFRMQAVESFPFPEVVDETRKNYVINEALMNYLREEWGPDVSPIGKELDGGIIVGVVKDFHWQPMTKKIGPILYGIEADDGYGRPGSLVVRIKDQKLVAGMDILENTFESIYPGRTLQFEFVDEKLAALYETYTLTARLIGYFASFTIFISCLGLLGLAYHAVSSKLKSLSIRKVLGASMSGLFYHFTKEFGLVILLASVIACPLAYLMMNKWLRSFAYRIDIEWQFFAMSITGMLLLVLVIVGIQFFKVASVNPSSTLRDE